MYRSEIWKNDALVSFWEIYRDGDDAKWTDGDTVRDADEYETSLLEEMEDA